jgi:hypothetical protein
MKKDRCGRDGDRLARQVVALPGGLNSVYAATTTSSCLDDATNARNDVADDRYPKRVSADIRLRNPAPSIGPIRLSGRVCSTSRRQARRSRSAATSVALAPVANSHGRQLAPTTGCWKRPDG